MGEQAGFKGEGTDGLGRAPITNVSHPGDAIVAHLAGELDLHNAGALREGLLAAVAEAPSRLVLDLAEVTFIDSTTLGVFIETRQALADSTLVLAAPGLEVGRALQVSGLDRHFEVRESVQEALGG
jgi:anti-anti-sigma factor